MLNCDKFFIEELQKAGYDIDYKKVVAIYRKSRENPAFIRRHKRRVQESIWFDEMMKKLEKE